MLFAAATVLSLTLSAFAGTLPAPTVPDSTTDGSLCSTSDPNFKEFRYKEKIPYCNRNVASSLKTQIYRHYGVPEECRSDYTIDHYYPLSLGGSNSRDNLWPEHREIKRVRQNLEDRLYYEIRAGQITQKQALAEINRFKMNPELNKISPGNYCDLVRPKFKHSEF